MKILSLGVYLDTFSIVFQNFDFWPFYGLFYRYFLAFFGYLLSVNELQVTHFDPGTLYFENIIFRSISRQIFNSFSKFWFFTILWTFLKVFFRYFLSVNELQVTHFDPGIFLLKIWSLELYQEISYEIVIFHHILGGLAYKHSWQETFAAGAVFRSSALCLLNIGLICCWVKKVHYKWVVRLVFSECQHIFCAWKCKPWNLTAYV